MKIIAATKNKNKLREFGEILTGFEIISQEDAGVDLDVEETGTTFEENALLKAESGCKESGMPCIADDSGLAVDYLDGAPGVYSARYAGEHGNDDANNKKLLKALEGIEPKDRGAAFVSVACCVYPDGRKIIARGECRGTIGFEEIGNGGFGYDPVFYCTKLCKTFGEASEEEKNNVSHRYHACALLTEKLKDYLKNN